MAAAPLAALDLPLKVLVWADEGQTKVSYYAPAAIAARHHLGPDLAGNLAGINALTDALVASSGSHDADLCPAWAIGTADVRRLRREVALGEQAVIQRLEQLAVPRGSSDSRGSGAAGSTCSM